MSMNCEKVGGGIWLFGTSRRPLRSVYHTLIACSSSKASTWQRKDVRFDERNTGLLRGRQIRRTKQRSAERTSDSTNETKICREENILFFVIMRSRFHCVSASRRVWGSMCPLRCVCANQEFVGEDICFSALWEASIYYVCAGKEDVCRGGGIFVLRFFRSSVLWV